MVAALDSWRPGPAKAAITEFVASVTGPGSDFVPAEERVAVFDNDGTLWCEKPMYIQLDFLIRRFAERARAEPALAQRQPYLAALAGDLNWFGEAVTKHYQGVDTDIKAILDAVLTAYSAISVDEHRQRVTEFFAEGTHPVLGRKYTACGYEPMIELVRCLEANEFSCYIVSGGGRDFMRPVTTGLYGIPPERVVGSSVGLEYRDGSVFTTAQPEFFDDGPMKPVRLWSRIGRRPIFAAGNSNGDIEMLEFTAAGTSPSLCLLVEHDDPTREFAYTAGAERALDCASARGWTVASIRDDWYRVFSA